MKAFVPDLAMVPRLNTSSSRLMPTPVSSMVNVLSILLAVMLMRICGSDSRTLGSVMDSYRILSRASDALEISSRKNTSLLE